MPVRFYQSAGWGATSANSAQVPPNMSGGTGLSKMLQGINRDPTASRDPCGSSFLLVYALRLASPDAFLPV